MKHPSHVSLLCAAVCAVLLSACQPAAPPAGPAATSIVVTYSILGSIVKDLVGNQASVVVLMPNGLDPHEWEPSAKDIETINTASLVVQNGLGLEGGLQKTLQQAKDAGVAFFTASDHIAVRRVGAGEGIPTGDPDQAVGADDPHLWTDPLAMKAVALALAARLKTDFGFDVASRAQDLATRLDRLNQEVAADVSALPEANRRLVTGHASLGYFAQRYGFKLVGAIIPSLTTQAEVSASDLADLKKRVQANPVKAIFTELGTSPAVAEVIGQETGAQVVLLATHNLPEDGSYTTFLRNLAQTVVDGLK